MIKRYSTFVFCLIACFLVPTRFAAAATAPAPGVIVGVSYVEHEPERQLDLWRDITMWGFIYNNSPESVTIDWRTRRLHCDCDKGRGADNSHHDLENLTEIPAGHIMFFHNAYYFFHGCGHNWHFEVADTAGRVYSLRAWPEETNYGKFQTLPKGIQDVVSHAFMADSEMRYKWWYKAQPIP